MELDFSTSACFNLWLHPALCSTRALAARTMPTATPTTAGGTTVPCTQRRSGRGGCRQPPRWARSKPQCWASVCSFFPAIDPVDGRAKRSRRRGGAPHPNILVCHFDSPLGQCSGLGIYFFADGAQYHGAWNLGKYEPWKAIVFLFGWVGGLHGVLHGRAASCRTFCR